MRSKHKVALLSGAFNHRVMLADTVRTSAYEQAIKQVVKPGMTVLDLGTGTGVLALMAARAGARVIAVDVDPIVHLAKQVAQDNGFGPEHITFHHADSRHLQLDRPVDCIVTECMGNFFVSDEMQRVLADAKRFLGPDGFFVPQFLTLYVAPIFFPQLYEVDFWAQEHYGFRFDAALEMALNRCYVYHVPGELLLSERALFRKIAFDDVAQDLSGSVTMTINRAITLHGFVGWFEAHLCDGVVLTTRPGGDTTHWGQTVFPLEPVSVQKGDQVELSLAISHEGDTVERIQWSGTIQRNGVETAQFSHDTNRRFVTSDD